ncbi:chain-length determining protein [Phaeobacter sp. 11ANDIMAR09]|uniref:chain-length determining protein n=1 Tax=Phaeobacter sp. 11ANDIMAR09 TaxID=1225647 RepID=UPI0006C83939|nr:chain-length determining protein [Phaeobacter sp. 11ANDIMAR09]KPD13006.1 chain-length determining protein [Phaeobacter sp. 11ANDIMAR09]
MGPIFSLADFLDMLRRRAAVILYVVVAGSILSLWMALNQQHMYHSAEVIQVTRPTIADELAKSTVEGSSARRMQLIEQRLMARGTLLEIIEKFALYADMAGLTPTEKVVMLRNAVSITGVAAVREGFADDGTISVLTITAMLPTAEQAQQVASEFGRRTIELSVSSRIAQARETLTFFAEKEAALASQITALEDEISAFHTANDVALPGTAEFRRNEVAAINQSLLDIEREKILIRRAADQASATERPATARRLLAEAQEQLATLDAQHDLLSQRKNELEAALQTTPEVQRQLGVYARQMQSLQGELEVVSTRRNEAEVGFRLETSNQGERLTVLEPAELADYPSTSARKNKALMGGFASILAGIGIAFLLELRAPVLRSAAQMERETGLAPVASIPVLDTRPRRRGLGDVLRSWRRLLPQKMARR